MTTQTIGLPLNPIGKQVKQEIKDYPYELGDCLIIAQTAYCTKWGVSYKVYRLEVSIKTKKVYLDVITSIFLSKFLSLGDSYLGDSYCLDNWETSLRVCDSLAIQQYMKKAF